MNGGAGTHSSGKDAVAIRLAGDPNAPANARRALARLHSDLDEPLLETMRLLVTELIANSVKHDAAVKVCLKVLVANSAVLVEVTDEGPGFTPTGRTKGQAETSGWGLFLVDRLANRWGVASEGAATRVWFELKR